MLWLWGERNFLNININESRMEPVHVIQNKRDGILQYAMERIINMVEGINIRSEKQTSISIFFSSFSIFYNMFMLYSTEVQVFLF